MTKVKIIFTSIILTLAVSLVSAQDPPPQNDFVDDKPKNRNQMIVEALGLTEEQQTQWRMLNRQGRLQSRDAQQQLKRAKEDLDQYIYSDSVDETTLQNKLRAVIQAQGEILRIRTMTEMSVRNILSPQQLAKWRDIRNKIKDQQKQKRLRQQRRQRMRRMNQNRRDNNRRDRVPQQRNRPL